MKSYIYGLVLAMQFFSAIPLRIEVPMTAKNIERSIRTFPVLGWLQGFIYASLLFGLLQWTNFSSLAIAFIIWLLIIVITGGIHLDGWMDASDAFFSYRDKTKRLEIMKDPRVGAFGVISVNVLLAARFLFIFEIVQRATILSYLLIMFIPFFGKMLMGMMLVSAPLARKKGMAHLFQQASRRKTLWIYPFYIALALAMMLIWQKDGIVFLLGMLSMSLFLYLYLRRKAVQWFGGITGDVVGASAEGTECGLWMIVWLFHYYGMG